MSAAAGGPKLEVLIVHAHTDAGFASELAEGLEYDGRARVTVADPSLSEREDSKTTRSDLIAAADMVVFVLSPAAAASPIFNWEADYAHELSKLMQPLLLQPLSDAAGPAPLAALAQVRFDGEHSFMEGLKGLVGRFPADTSWLQDHTMLSVRARQWDQARRPVDQLLTNDETIGAKNWTVARPDDAPKPSDLHLEFIAESEAAGQVPSPQEQADEAPAPQEEQNAESAPTADSPKSLRSANRFYAIMSLLLAAVAALAAWQAWESKKQIAVANEKVRAQLQIAELSKVTLAIQKERIEDAIKTVNTSLCMQAQKVTSTLATTSAPAVWDSNYDLFWTLYEGPMIALEQLHGTLSETDRSPVADAMIGFGKDLGTRGEPYEARVAGLPKTALMAHAANITNTCKKISATP